MGAPLPEAETMTREPTSYPEDRTMTTTLQLDAITKHGENLLAIFPNATERDPVQLCKKLRRLESQAEALAVRLCNGPEFPETAPNSYEARTAAILAKVNKLLGNVNEYQPKTGAKCGCRRGIQRDNCPNCEGTGHVIDFRAIRNRKHLLPVFLNGDPRGYSLKINDEWMRKDLQRSHTCLDCGTEWAAMVRFSEHTQNLSGEPQEYCPACRSRNVMSSPAHSPKLHRDWGGYGILAPEIGKNGN
jgi:hypothetical protein